MSVTQPLSSFKRAGLLMRDAASLLCGTVLFEFELEQAKSLQKRLGLVMEVLPAVELEMSRFGEAEWARLREDLETLLEACEAFQRDPPASVPCDRYDELGDPKRRVHADLTSLKIAIIRIVKSAEAQTAVREARVAAEAQAAADEAGRVPSAQAAPHAAPAQDHGSKLARQTLVAPPLVTEKDSGAVELATTVAAGLSTDPERTEVGEADAVSEGKKKGKKKKKKAKPLLITERPIYPIRQEEQPISEELRRLAQTGLQETGLQQLLSAVEGLLHPPPSLGLQAPSLGLQLELASRLFFAVSRTMCATSNAERPVDQLLAASTKAGEVYAACLQQHPEDAFVRWDLARSLFWRTADAMSSDFKDTVTEAIHHVRYFHLHGRHFGPLFDEDPLHFTTMLCHLLASFASLIKSDDQALALRTYEEVLALSGTPPPDQVYQEAMCLARWEAAEHVARSYLAEGDINGAMAAAARGLETAFNMREGSEETASLARKWCVKLVEVAKLAWRAEEKRLAKLHSIRKTQTQARKILGQPDSDAQQAELESLARDRDGVRKALRDLEEVLEG